MIDEIPKLLHKMTPNEQRELFELLALYKKQEKEGYAKDRFLEFVELIWPHFVSDTFIAGRHHKIIAEKFEQIASGKIKRLIINMPPRHTKSEFGSYLLPAWFMGKFPHKKIIQSSHTADKALEFGRKVRNLVAAPQFQAVFKDVFLQADSKAAGKWSTNKGGSYFAVGVGGAVAGYGADLMIIDDPHSEQDGKSLNADAFDSTYDWFMTGPRQRLQPGGAILLIMCMTGDTNVLMADGTTSKLKHIRAGDEVATYEKGKITAARVNNWRSSGIDHIYTVQTQSGTTLRANKRHPFLVDFGGERKWVKLGDLQVGMSLVATKDAADQKDHSSSRLSTYDVFLDQIVNIHYSGKEEVFDVEIDRTENFIANGVVSHNTRWSKRDLTGRLLDYSAKNPDADQWEVVEFPAILPSGNPVWPEFWSIEELEATKATIHPRFWAAQYQQEPTSSETAIIKKDWWKIWEHDYPPQCEYVIQSWDTAFTKNERSDYSACTTWGVFYSEGEVEVGGKKKEATVPNIILLDSFKEKMEFPELKEVAFKHYKEFNPDTLIVEAKASGQPLISELRQMGIPVQEFVPSRGNDKIARVNAVADLFASGVIWCPDTRWAYELVEEVADFPNGEHDDLVDSMTQALLRYRQGGFIRVPSDHYEEPSYKRTKHYY